MNAEEMMTPEVVCVSPDDSLQRAAQLMWEHDLGFLPVITEDGDLDGVITDRDVCMAAYTRGIRLEDNSVQSVMSGDVFTVSPRANMTQIEALMRQERVRRLPVIDQGQRLVGQGPGRDGPVQGEDCASKQASKQHPIRHQ